MQQQSLISWLLHSLGYPYLAMMLSTGLLALIVAVVVVLRGKGPFAVSALVLTMPMPFLIGLFAALQAGMSMYQVIATSTTPPKPAELAGGISTALVAPLTGLLLMAPAWTVAAFGSVIRACTSRPERPEA